MIIQLVFKQVYQDVVYIVSDPEFLGAGSLLRKYLTLLCAHVSDVLPVAASLAAYSSKHFSIISRIVANDVAGNSPIHTFVYYQMITKQEM